MGNTRDVFVLRKPVLNQFLNTFLICLIFNPDIGHIIKITISYIYIKDIYIYIYIYTYT